MLNVAFNISKTYDYYGKFVLFFLTYSQHQRPMQLPRLLSLSSYLTNGRAVITGISSAFAVPSLLSRKYLHGSEIYATKELIKFIITDVRNNIPL